MNQISLTGRLTRDIEVRVTQNNTKVVNNCIAVKRAFAKDGEEKTDFIDFEVWGQSARFLEAYAQKGSMIALVGDLRVDKYTDKEGNDRKKIYVLADSVEIISQPKDKPKSVEEQNREFGESLSGTGYEKNFGTYDSGMVDESDLPFY